MALNPAAFSNSSIRSVEMLARIPEIAAVNLEGNNRTWDTIVESGDTLGVYTESRPPFGCLGLTLGR